MLNLSNRSVAVYQGPLDPTEINKAFAEALEAFALILEVECPLSSLTAGRSLLESLGFTFAGTVSGDRETCVRFKKKIRDAGDGLAAGDMLTRTLQFRLPSSHRPTLNVSRANWCRGLTQMVSKKKLPRLKRLLP